MANMEGRSITLDRACKDKNRMLRMILDLREIVKNHVTDLL